MLSHSRVPHAKSTHQREFAAEMNIHFLGRKGFEIPTVWVFPTILVGMDCGVTQFTIPEDKRKEPAARDYRDFIDGAAG